MINSIILQSGGLFDFGDPGGSEFTIEDIAHNLSNICRFNGGCDSFYSVAQHSVGVSLILEGTGFERYGLLHDAAEAFYGDMTTWLKKLCPDYRAQLERGEDAVARRFGLPSTMPEQVKRADYLMLAIERRRLFQTTKLTKGNDGFHHLNDIPDEEVVAATALVDLNGWQLESPRLARRNFLERWEEVKDRV